MKSGDNAYISVYEEVLTSGNNSKDDIFAFAEENGVNTGEIEACLENNESADQVSQKFARGRDTF